MGRGPRALRSARDQPSFWSPRLPPPTGGELWGLGARCSEARETSGPSDGAWVSLQVDRNGAVLGNREIERRKGTRLPLVDAISSLSTFLWICVRDAEAPITPLPFPPPAVPLRFRVTRRPSLSRPLL